mmetsp:Transcript_11176/g.18785  ORF Transcript_11176/g.18785 Transcript_11176/m.18785 type:complete len:115 (-) Transcript_11176:640-984(-)
MPLVKALGLEQSIKYEFLSVGIMCFVGIFTFTVTMRVLISGVKSLLGLSDDFEEEGGRSKGKAGRRGVSDAGSGRSRILITGPSNSGKTALFYYLFTGEFRPTVSSVSENVSSP